jgi:hypothetical protein
MMVDLESTNAHPRCMVRRPALACGPMTHARTTEPSPLTPPVTLQLWRVTGSGQDGAPVTIQFDRTGDAKPTTDIDRASILATANLIRSPNGGPRVAGLLLVELSEDGGETWRVVLDERDMYAGPPPRDPGPLAAEDVAGLRALAHRYDDDPDPTTRAFLVRVATRVAATLAK